MKNLDPDSTPGVDRLLRDIESFEAVGSDTMSAYAESAVAGGLAVVARALFYRLIISINISRVLSRASGSMKELAVGEGNLNTTPSISIDDELGDLAGWFDAFLGKIREFLANMTDLIAKNDILASRLSESSEETASSLSSVARRGTALRERSEAIDSDISQASSAVEHIMRSIGSLAAQMDQQFASIEQTSFITEKIHNFSEDTRDNADRIAETLKTTMEKIALATDVGDESVDYAALERHKKLHAVLEGEFAEIEERLKAGAFDASPPHQDTG